MGDGFDVVVSAGTLSSSDTDAVRFPHRWTPDGVTVDADFTGAHLLHLAAAGCVLNDIYREATELGIELYEYASKRSATSIPTPGRQGASRTQYR
jgi:hypothetical protein